MKRDGLEIFQWTYNSDEDPIHVLARGIEADVHAKGWDGHARFAIVLQNEVTVDNGEGPEPAHSYAALEVPMFSEFYGDPSAGLVTWVSEVLRNPDAILHLYGMLETSREQFYGLAMVVETWLSKDSEPEEKLEGRDCIVVLEEGRIVIVNRARNMTGGLDEIAVVDNKDQDSCPGGLVLWNMLALWSVMKNLASHKRSDIESWFK